MAKVNEIPVVSESLWTGEGAVKVHRSGCGSNIHLNCLGTGYFCPAIYDAQRGQNCRERRKRTATDPWTRCGNGGVFVLDGSHFFLQKFVVHCCVFSRFCVEKVKNTNELTFVARSHNPRVSHLNSHHVRLLLCCPCLCCHFWRDLYNKQLQILSSADNYRRYQKQPCIKHTSQPW